MKMFTSFSHENVHIIFTWKCSHHFHMKDEQTSDAVCSSTHVNILDNIRWEIDSEPCQVIPHLDCYLTYPIYFALFWIPLVGAKWNSVCWCQINGKNWITIQMWFNSTRFREDISVCIAPNFSTWLLIMEVMINHS